MKLVISSDKSKIGAVINRDLTLREILTMFSKVEVPQTEDEEKFDEAFKESVKKAVKKQ